MHFAQVEIATFQKRPPDNLKTSWRKRQIQKKLNLKTQNYVTLNNRNCPDRCRDFALAHQRIHSDAACNQKDTQYRGDCRSRCMAIGSPRSMALYCKCSPLV